MLWLLAQEAEKATPLEQLPPPERLVVVSSLLGLVLTGLGLILLTAIGARWVRRIARERRPPRQWDQPRQPEPAPDDPPPPPAIDSPGETLVDPAPTDDTQN